MKFTRRSPVLTHLALFGILLSGVASPAARAQPTTGKKDSATTRADALAAYAQDLTSAARGAAPSADDYGNGVRQTRLVGVVVFELTANLPSRVWKFEIWSPSARLNSWE